MSDNIGISPSELYALFPNEQPNATDIIFGQKANGDPTVYPVSRLMDYLEAAMYPSWLTNTQAGMLARAFVDGDGQFAHTAGVVPFATIIYDSGYYVSVGTFQVPTGVTVIEVAASISTTGATPTAKIIKNTTEELSVVTGSGGYVAVNNSFSVAAGDTIQITCDDAVQIKESTETMLSIRTVAQV